MRIVKVGRGRYALLAANGTPVVEGTLQVCMAYATDPS